MTQSICASSHLTLGLALVIDRRERVVASNGGNPRINTKLSKEG
jgi:hypothetical protein